jgi:hypothetical protein
VFSVLLCHWHIQSALCHESLSFFLDVETDFQEKVAVDMGVVGEPDARLREVNLFHGLQTVIFNYHYSIVIYYHYSIVIYLLLLQYCYLQSLLYC